MAKDNTKEQDGAGRSILSPKTWFLLSFTIWSIVIVPITMGAFYILRISNILFDLENQYSALFGLIFGLIISLVVGYIYAGKARKLAE